MAELTYKGGLTAWYKPSWLGASSSNPWAGWWPDQAGTYWTQTKDLGFVGNPSQLPAGGVEFNQGATLQYATPGPNWNAFIGVNAGFILCAFKASAVVGVSATMALNDGLIASYGTYTPAGFILKNVSGVYHCYAIHHDATNGYVAVDCGTINLGQVYVAVWLRTGTTLKGGLDPFTLASATVANNDILSTNSLNVAMGKATKFQGTVYEILIGNTYPAEGDLAAMYNYLAAEWAGRGDSEEIGRDVASRVLIARGQSRLRFYALGAPMDTVAPITLAEQNECFVSDPTGLHPQGLGWGETYDWQPRPGRVMEKRLDFDAATVDYGFADLRTVRHTLMFSNRLSRLGDRREGEITGADSCVEMYARKFDAAASDLSRDPAEGRSYFGTAPGQRVLTPDGYTALTPDTHQRNMIYRSCFISNLTGFPAASGTGVNGSAIALDANDTLLVNVNDNLGNLITPSSLKFTAGSPPGADLYQSWPASGAYYGTPSVWLTFITKPTDATLSFFLQRSSDSKYWNGPTDAANWSAGKTWIPITPDSYYRYNVRVPVASGSGTITVSVGFPQAGTANGAIGHVYLIAGHKGFCPVHLAANDNVLPDHFAEQLYKVLTGSLPANTPLGAQTIFFRFQPWRHVDDDSAMASPDILKIGDICGMGTYGWKLSWAASTYTWSAVASGGTFTTTGPATWTPMAWHRVAIRRISSHGDLGLTPYQTDIFHNGVKVGGAVETYNPAITYPGHLKVEAFAGVAGEFFASPYALTDEEIAAWMVGA